MKSLIWREYRLNGLLLVAGVCLLLLPYVFTLGVFLWPRATRPSPGDIVEGFFTAAILSYALSQLTIAFLGGNAFAGERSDRSAEFMAYLPVSKTRRVISKLSLIAIVTALIWGINLFVLWRLESSPFWGIKVPEDFFPATLTAITGFVMFGVSWFLSSLLPSPALSVCGELATPIVTLMGLQISAWAFEVKSVEYERLMETGYVTISIGLGVLGLIAGTWFYLKRVEP